MYMYTHAYIYIYIYIHMKHAVVCVEMWRSSSDARVVGVGGRRGPIGDLHVNVSRLFEVSAALPALLFGLD